MVQIGNIHIGKAETAKEPTISIMEASLLWDLLVARYNCIEETQKYLQCAKDLEFKAFIERVGLVFLESQANEIEKQMIIYKLPFPKRPPKCFTQSEENICFSDQCMFTRIFEGCQGFIRNMAYCLTSAVMNDPLRQMFYKFLKEEVAIFDNMCKYGKQKGWIELSPTFKA